MSMKNNTNSQLEKDKKSKEFLEEVKVFLEQGAKIDAWIRDVESGKIKPEKPISYKKLPKINNSIKKSKKI